MPAPSLSAKRPKAVPPRGKHLIGEIFD